MGTCHSNNSALKHKSKAKKKLCKTQNEKRDSNLNEDQLKFIDSNLKKTFTMSSLSSTNSELTTDSESSLEMNSNLSSKQQNSQRTIPVLSTLSQNKSSLTRLVYKPSQLIQTSLIQTSNCSIKTTCLVKTQSQADKQEQNENLIETNQINNKLLINNNNNNSKNQALINNNNTSNRRGLSPFRSFIKPPTAFVNSNSKQKLNESQNSNLSNKSKHNQSSSLSSLSSTSSCLSNKLNESNESNQAQTTTTTTTTTNNSKTIQPAQAKTVNVTKQSPSTNTNCSKHLPSSNPPNSLLPSPNKMKPKSNSFNKPVQQQQQKRLFSPYKFNSNKTNTDNHQKTDANNTENDKKEISNFKKDESVLKDANTSGSKLKFSYSKMPIPVKSNLKTINSNSSNISSSNNNDNKNSSSSCSILLKRDDSAYNSSTSSTVSSSNDVDCANKSIDLNKTENVLNEANQELIDKNLENTEKLESLDKINFNEKSISSSSNPVKHTSSLRTRSSIQDSVGELNHLMLISSSSICSTVSNHEHDNSKTRRTSSSSLAVQSNSHSTNSPMFKPPSNLPPIENCDKIILDIESYRLLMQDLQNTKLVLHKLANLLREPSILNCSNDQENLNQSDDLQNMVNNPLLSSFYQHNVFESECEKLEQSTQTD